MKTMLEMIYSIPENIGWVIVGAFAMLALILLIVDIRILYHAIKDRIEVWQEERNEIGA